MHDMASASLSRSGQSRRSPHKLKGRPPKSSVDSLEDSSRESSVTSSVSTPVRRPSRKQPASAPVEIAAKRKKSSRLKNGESVYLSPLSDPLEPAPHESSKLAMDIATNNLPIIRPDVTAIPLSNKSKIKKKKTKPSDPRQSRMSPHVILQQLKDGIDSNDTDTIFRILEENDVKLVNETVQNMPVEFVSRLLEFLKKKICRKTVKTANSLLWLEQLLQSKLTFLLSLPGAKSAIAPLSETLNTRIEVFDCVLKLKGRLNLLTAQASEKAREQKPQTNISGKAAIVEFEDSSGDEAQECFAVESFATNQLSLSGIGPGSSDEEVDEPDSDDGETQDIEYD